MTLDEKKELALKQDINVLLQNMGHQPVKQAGNNVWYVSPFNPSEKTASFHVSKGRQINTIWYDFSTGKSGNIINLVREMEGLRFGESIDFILAKTNQLSVEGQLNFTTTPLPLKEKEQENKDRYELQKVKDISSPAILNYLERERGLERAVIKTYIKQVHFLDTNRNKPYYAGGVKNIDGGYEVNHKIGKKFKSAIPSSSKSISFFESNVGENKKIQVFSGFIDALSHITYQNSTQLQKTRYFDIDTLILNSDRLSSKAIEFIKKGNYEQIMGYFDHDKSGNDVLAEFKQEFGDRFTDASKTYQGYNDYNDFLVGVRKENSKFR